MKRIVFIILVLLGGIGNYVSEFARGNPIEFFSVGDGLTFVHYFGFEHTEGAHEKYVPVEDNELLGGMGEYIELSSSPYPFSQLLTDDVRNKSSTLPVDISCILIGTASAGNCYLYINIIAPIDYQHRDLTIQEVDPLNPNDPNNTNPIQDIRTLPVEYEMYRYDLGTLNENVERMFRIGVYRKLAGDFTENGTVDPNDFTILADEWTGTTNLGDNHLVSDINHDSITDYKDFALFAITWLEVE